MEQGRQPGPADLRGGQPPNGAIIDYYLKADAKTATITVVDQAGKTVRQLTDVPKAAGVNRTEWDLRFDAPRNTGPNPFAALMARQARGRRGQAARRGGGFGFGGGAPYVLPGNYTVRLAVDGQEVSKPVTVRLDPRADVPMTDLAAQLDQALELQQLQGQVAGMIARTDDLMRQLTNLQQRLRGPRQSPDQADLAGIVQTALEKLKTLRDTKMTRPAPVMNYRQYPRLAEEVRTVLGIVNGDPFPPTDGATLRYKELVSEQAAVQGELDAIVTNEIAKINQAMASSPYISAGGPIR